MKRSVCAVLLIFLAAIAIAQPKPVIAVLDFEASGVSKQEMKAIISLISNTLFKTGKFTVIDVAQRETLLKEIEFSLSDCVEESCQIEIGKQLSAEMVVVGRIDKVGSNFIFASKVLETQSARTINAAGGVYRNLDELVRNIENLGIELAGLPPTVPIPKTEERSPAAPSTSKPPIRQPTAPVFVLVGPGSFQMGSIGAGLDEQPIHTVTISRAFYMSLYEVTQREWREVMGTNHSRFKGDSLPVESVSWYEVIEYCNRLSRKEVLATCYSGSGDQITCDFSANGYRLPTEAEWEYAARGGNQSQGYTCAGSNSPEEISWYEANSARTTHPVGKKRPNELGLYDMSGNVEEWCWDWYWAYSSALATDPRGLEDGSRRVDRGGGWFYAAGNLRSANRSGGLPAFRSSGLGFRPVRTAE